VKYLGSNITGDLIWQKPAGIHTFYTLLVIFSFLYRKSLHNGLNGNLYFTYKALFFGYSILPTR